MYCLERAISDIQITKYDLVINLFLRCYLRGCEDSLALTAFFLFEVGLSSYLTRKENIDCAS